MTTSKFEVQVMDDPDFEDLVAEILYDGEYCFLISQELGFQNLEIQVHGKSTGDPWQFKVSELEDLIGRVRKRLWELRRT